MLDHCDTKFNQVAWLEENPSDWEQHVIDCGDPMYRLMLLNCPELDQVGNWA